MDEHLSDVEMSDIKFDDDNGAFFGFFDATLPLDFPAAVPEHVPNDVNVPLATRVAPAEPTVYGYTDDLLSSSSSSSSSSSTSSSITPAPAGVTNVMMANHLRAMKKLQEENAKLKAENKRLQCLQEPAGTTTGKPSPPPQGWKGMFPTSQFKDELAAKVAANTRGGALVPAPTARGAARQPPPPPPPPPGFVGLYDTVKRVMNERGAMTITASGPGSGHRVADHMSIEQAMKQAAADARAASPSHRPRPMDVDDAGQGPKPPPPPPGFVGLFDVKLQAQLKAKARAARYRAASSRSADPRTPAPLPTPRPLPADPPTCDGAFGSPKRMRLSKTVGAPGVGVGGGSGLGLPAVQVQQQVPTNMWAQAREAQTQQAVALATMWQASAAAFHQAQLQQLRGLKRGRSGQQRQQQQAQRGHVAPQGHAAVLAAQVAALQAQAGFSPLWPSTVPSMASWQRVSRPPVRRRRKGRRPRPHKMRTFYKCGKCGLPKKNHLCPKERGTIEIQCELEPSMTLAQLKINRGFAGRGDANAVLSVIAARALSENESNPSPKQKVGRATVSTNTAISISDSFNATSAATRPAPSPAPMAIAKPPPPPLGWVGLFDVEHSVTEARATVCQETGTGTADENMTESSKPTSCLATLAKSLNSCIRGVPQARLVGAAMDEEKK